MITRIHLSKKLEKSAKKIEISAPDPGEKMTLLEKWNANLFFISRKKCWLLTNSKTRYSVLLKDMNAGNLENIQEIFKDRFFNQLRYDGIQIEFTEIEKLVGELKFCPTDNDRRTLGIQNQHFQALDYRKSEYGSFGNFPFQRINHQLNTYPFWDKKKSSSALSSGMEGMREILGH